MSFLLRIAHDKARALAEGKTESLSSLPADKVLMEQIVALSSQIVSVKSEESEDTQKEGSKPKQANTAVRARAMQARVLASTPVAHAGTNF